MSVRDNSGDVVRSEDVHASITRQLAPNVSGNHARAVQSVSLYTIHDVSVQHVHIETNEYFSPRQI